MGLRVGKTEQLVATSDSVELRRADFTFIQDGASLTELANRLNEAIKNGGGFLVGVLDIGGDEALPSIPKKAPKGDSVRNVYCDTKTDLFDLVTNAEGKTERINYTNDEHDGAPFFARFVFGDRVEAPPATNEATTANTEGEGETADDLEEGV